RRTDVVLGATRARRYASSLTLGWVTYLGSKARANAGYVPLSEQQPPVGTGPGRSLHRLWVLVPTPARPRRGSAKGHNHQSRVRELRTRAGRWRTAEGAARCHCSGNCTVCPAPGAVPGASIITGFTHVGASRPEPLCGERSRCYWRWTERAGVCCFGARGRRRSRSGCSCATRPLAPPKSLDAHLADRGAVVRTAGRGSSNSQPSRRETKLVPAI